MGYTTDELIQAIADNGPMPLEKGRAIVSRLRAADALYEAVMEGHPDPMTGETFRALEAYRKACEGGRT